MECFCRLFCTRNCIVLQTRPRPVVDVCSVHKAEYKYCWFIHFDLYWQIMVLKAEYIYRYSFLGAFAKLWEATISYVIFVRLSFRPSACPQGTTRLWLDGFWWNSVFRLFRKSVENIQFSLTSDKNNGYFTWTHFYIYDNISLNSF
jgi:hypothetical protein